MENSNACVQILIEGDLIKNGKKADFISQLNKADKKFKFCLEIFEEAPSEEQVESSDIIICKASTYLQVIKDNEKLMSNCSALIFTVSLGKTLYEKAEALIKENSLWTSSFDLSALYVYDRIFMGGYLKAQ